MLQGGERPGGSAITCAIRPAAKLGQNALVLGGTILKGGTTAMAGHQSREALAIEAADKGRYSVVGTPANSMSGCGVAQSISHGQEQFGALDMTGGLAVGTTDLGEHVALLGSKWA